MTDDSKPVADTTPTEEPKVEEPQPEQPQSTEPKGEEPVSSPAEPEEGSATPAGTDQSGRQLYNVKCAACGKQAQVPFKPSGGRPVYCKDCYMKQRRERSGGGMNK